MNRISALFNLQNIILRLDRKMKLTPHRYNEVTWRKSRSSHHILLCSQLDIFSMSDWYLDPACECHPNQPERKTKSSLFKSDVLRQLDQNYFYFDSMP